jgi:phosphoenolpyruvate carboxylase
VYLAELYYEYTISYLRLFKMSNFELPVKHCIITHYKFTEEFDKNIYCYLKLSEEDAALIGKAIELHNELTDQYSVTQLSLMKIIVADSYQDAVAEVTDVVIEDCSFRSREIADAIKSNHANVPAEDVEDYGYAIKKVNKRLCELKRQVVCNHKLYYKSYYMHEHQDCELFQELQKIIEVLIAKDIVVATPPPCMPIEDED